MRREWRKPQWTTEMKQVLRRTGAFSRWREKAGMRAGSCPDPHPNPLPPAGEGARGFIRRGSRGARWGN